MYQYAAAHIQILKPYFILNTKMTKQEPWEALVKAFHITLLIEYLFVLLYY